MMTSSSLFPTVVVLGLVLAGCAPRGAHIPKTADREGVVRGSVSYRERTALPSDAVVEVWITDVSKVMMASPLMAETTFQSGGRQVPLPFELRYDPSKIERDHEYAVKAVIRSAGQILFATDTPYHVITKANPIQLAIWLTRVAGGSSGEATGLVGTLWRLEDLGGAGVLDRVEVTLEFREAGKVAGSGSCNRIFGTVEISAQKIKFGSLGSTRMSCMEAVMKQEANYLRALEGAERFTVEGAVLLLYTKGMDRPLRFIRTKP